MMTIPFEKKVWLSSPTMHGDELYYIKEAYETNWMSTVGANLDAIEQDVCEAVGCKHAVAVASGTSALHLGIKLAGVKAGDRVFCSDLTFAATANPIKYEGATPIFIDSERDTWNMCPDALEKAFQLYPDVNVVVIVHLFGTPAKMDQILSVCAAHNAVLIEDAAESFGATYQGIQTGNFGDYNCISFNGNKIITGSSGGMFLCNDEVAAQKARKWSSQAREAAPWYQHNELGYNYRMSNVIAGVVRGQLPHLEEHLARKKAIYERYREGFLNIPVTMNPHEQGVAQPSYWLSCLLVDKDAMCIQSRSNMKYSYTSEPGKTCPHEILDTLISLNAEGRPIWKPMHAQPYYQDCPFVTCSGGEAVDMDIFQRGLCLPSDIKMTPDQQDIIIETVRKCFV